MALSLELPLSLLFCPFYLRYHSSVHYGTARSEALAIQVNQCKAMDSFQRMPPSSQSARTTAAAVNAAWRRLSKMEKRIGAVERATGSTRRRLTNIEKRMGAVERITNAVLHRLINIEGRGSERHTREMRNMQISRINTTGIGKIKA